MSKTGKMNLAAHPLGLRVSEDCDNPGRYAVWGWLADNLTEDQVWEKIREYRQAEEDSSSD